jgi:hypothetical protein
MNREILYGAGVALVVIAAGVIFARRAALALPSTDDVAGYGANLGAGIAAGAGGVVAGGAKEIGSWFGIPREADTECATFSMNCTPAAAIDLFLSYFRDAGGASEPTDPWHNADPEPFPDWGIPLSPFNVGA